MARRVFYSFQYKPDNWRVAMVRNIGVIEGNQPAKDNDWESVTSGGDDAIKRWITGQMYGRSCTVVLVGSGTAKRKWIDYEIKKTWDEHMGLVGIHIHGLKDKDGQTAPIGANPFSHIGILGQIVKCYNPAGATSAERYDWIKTHLSNAVEEAIKIRNNH
jgi:hypothetical protein